MSSQIRCPPDNTNNSHLGAFAVVRVEDIERVGLRVDAGNNLLAFPFPGRGIPKVGDVFVRALRVRFGDASNLTVRHNSFLYLRGIFGDEPLYRLLLGVVFNGSQVWPGLVVGGSCLLSGTVV